MKTIRQIYETFRRGDPLTDAELLAGIEYFGDLASKAGAVGPEYSLVARDARITAATMNDYYASRKRDK